ncbi:DNA-directed RNA polymerase subunit E'' [archaeon]|nr:DNA-directed RNA polymerase subunit E'' [archaeon]
MVQKACPKCKRIVEGKECPVCKNSKLSNRWYGLLVILDKDSELAKEMDMEPGKYALKVK